MLLFCFEALLGKLLARRTSLKNANSEKGALVNWALDKPHSYSQNAYYVFPPLFTHVFSL